MISGLLGPFRSDGQVWRKPSEMPVSIFGRNAPNRKAARTRMENCSDERSALPPRHPGIRTLQGDRRGKQRPVLTGCDDVLFPSALTCTVMSVFHVWHLGRCACASVVCRRFVNRPSAPAARWVCQVVVASVPGGLAALLFVHLRGPAAAYRVKAHARRPALRPEQIRVNFSFAGHQL